MIKVLSLFSGSLASRVATRLVERHPEVEAVYLLHFRSPFADELEEDLRRLVKDEWPGVSFRTQSLKREYRCLVEESPAGRFSLARSCFSCRVLLLARAVRYMERVDAQYIVTGEIAGEHGVRCDDLLRIADSLSLRNRVLRPLCSGMAILKTTGLSDWAYPSGNGSFLTDRNRLFDLADELGLEACDPLTSHRRCKLTMTGFGERAANLFSERSGFTLNALRLLDFQRYYKIAPDIKVVIAMDDQEKRSLQNLFLPQDLRVYPATPHGPMTLVRAAWDEKSVSSKEQIIGLAARITATHVAGGRASMLPIYYRFESEDETWLINAMPFESTDEIGLLDCVDVIPLDLRRTPIA